MDDKLFLRALRRPESNLRRLPKKYGEAWRRGSGPNRTPHFREELRAERKAVRQRTETPPIVVARELAEHMPPTLSYVTMSFLQVAHRLNELDKLEELISPLTNLPEECGDLISRLLCYIGDIGSEKMERLIDDGQWVGEVERLCFEFRAEAETISLPMTDESAF